MSENWEPYQKKFWTDNWENSSYSLQDLIDGDPFEGVKFSPLLPQILNYLKKDTKILEAGCGMGQWVIYLSDCGFDITGLDFSEPVIEKLKFLYPEKKFLVGDITNFEFTDKCFDVILSWGVVEHFIDGPLVPLKEANRILKEDGILFITVPCNNILQSLLKLRVGIVKVARKFSGKATKTTPFYQYTFRETEFLNYLKNAGFVILKVIPISHEIRFVTIMNTLFKYKKETHFFHKNKGGEWQGLTPTGKIICSALKKISPWLTPDFMFVIAKKA